MGEPTPSPEAVYRKLHTLTTVVSGGMVFILVFAVSLTTLMLWQAVRVGEQSERIKQVAIETHDALCALRSDVNRRYRSGVEYLKEHPEGVPSLDLTPNDLRRSLDSQRATLAALGPLKCG